MRRDPLITFKTHAQLIRWSEINLPSIPKRWAKLETTGLRVRRAYAVSIRHIPWRKSQRVSTRGAIPSHPSRVLCFTQQEVTDTLFALQARKRLVVAMSATRLCSPNGIIRIAAAPGELVSQLERMTGDNLAAFKISGDRKAPISEAILTHRPSGTSFRLQ